MARSLPRKVTYFEPVPPRFTRNTIREVMGFGWLSNRRSSRTAPARARN